MTCPFSRDRLHELLWIEKWRPDQVAALAQAGSGETVTPGDVEAWCRKVGITVPPLPSAAPPSPARAPKPNLVCERCGESFPRPRNGRNARYCGIPCSQAARRAQAETRLARLNAEAEAAKAGILPERIPELVLCAGCKHHKPPSEFVIDRSRSSLTKLCRPCQGAKNREYYERNRERLLERARTRKQNPSPEAGG